MTLLSAFVTVAALAVNLLSGTLGVSWLAGVAKMTASCGFLALAASAGAFQTPYGRVLFAGLFFSWWGDLFLIFPGFFLWGLIAFFLGHVLYSVAFIVQGVDWVWTAVALALLAIPFYFVHRWLGPHVGDMRVPVYAYMVVISIMVACAAGTLGRGGHKIMLLGALLFYLSDLFVARGRFVESGPINGWIGLPLYYFGQLALAYSARFAGR